MFDCTCLRLSRLNRLARAEAATDFDGFCTCLTESKHAVVHDKGVVHDEGSNCRHSDTFVFGAHLLEFRMICQLGWSPVDGLFLHRDYQ
jgi:hypothetical protein